MNYEYHVIFNEWMHIWMYDLMLRPVVFSCFQWPTSAMTIGGYKLYGKVHFTKYDIEQLAIKN